MTEKAQEKQSGSPSLFRLGLYAMLLFVPATLIAEFVLHADPTLIFFLSALAIIPLADLVGEATEEIALYIGPRFGGLLNATLGNLAELIITIFALREGLVELVRASIAGSVIGNLLLIMGLSFFLGGLKNGKQDFNRRSAGMTATLIVLAVLALLVPSLFDVAIVGNQAAELGLSEGVAIIMIVLYAVNIFYTFTRKDEGMMSGHGAEEAKWSVKVAVGVLIGATAGIVLMSEALVGVIETVSVNLGLSEIFIGVIIIPLVGNVAEHLVAVQAAYKNKMELSLAVSLGSSLQIALFVAPILVFISLVVGGEPLLLVFNNFELIAMMGAAIIAVFIAQDGESNWFEGVMLLAVYLILAVAFFFLPVAVEVASAATALY